LGLGIAHLIPFVAYLGFWVMIIASLAGRAKLGLYFMIPFLPYRSMRNHFLEYPMGNNLLTMLIVAIIIGALTHGKRLPKSKLYLIWLVFGFYLYCSMWLGTALGNAPAPLWLSDPNFVVWKDYMIIPLVFVAASLVIDDRKAVRTVIIISALTILVIDRSFIMQSMSRSWASFDESKRDEGPLAYGSNETAAFFAQFAIFFWGFVQFVKNKKMQLLGYGLIALTLFATMYTFSRGGYLAVLAGVFMLGLLKSRKLLIILVVFLLTWQVIVPDAVRERVMMTKNAYGQLESSAQERVDLWKESWESIIHSPIVGNGFGTFQLGQHVDNLKDTHNWYVKVLVETGIVGMIIVLVMLSQLLLLGFRLFKKAEDPLYRGLGLGLFIALCASMVANFFGDRWTLLEITGMLWVLAGAAVRATQLMSAEAPPKLAEDSATSMDETRARQLGYVS
jgi:putative inorganic carbon (hco3(-)) transporter